MATVIPTDRNLQSFSPEEEIFSDLNYNFTCIQCIDDHCSYETLCGNAIQCYQSQLVDSSGSATFSRGCILEADKVPFICSTSYQTQNEYYNVRCCQGNLCNNETFSKAAYIANESANPSMAIVIYIIIGVVGCSAIFSLLAFILKRVYYYRLTHKYSKCDSLKKSKNLNHMNRDEIYTAAGDSTLREIFTDSFTSGSGYGLPLLVQRTLAKNISLESMIGKGRYGEVWKGTWQGETVAVKIFLTRSENESSWARETEIYSNVVIRHENILGFYGSDMVSSASCIQFWLVTNYHPKGSLRDYISAHALNFEELFSACISIVSGLLFLHTEIMGNQGKPAIAHRDINSKNVLMKEDGTCCISDLGLAVFRDPKTEEINSGNNSRSGTMQYMSPEVLNQSFNLQNIESYKKADIYAVAIVLWESVSCCDAIVVLPDYQVPFSHLFFGEPSYEEMKDAVCIQHQRPYIPDYWKENHIIDAMLNIITECWNFDPDVRLSALRMKKNITKLAIDENIPYFSS